MLRTVCYAFVALTTTAVSAHAGVVINEVMYRPYNQLTFGRFEYTEVTNTGATDVDLGGAFFTDSQDFASICAGFEPHDHEGVFAIPSGTIVPAGGYLTFTHGGITGPNTVNYTDQVFFSNIVLNDGGDQVSLIRCDGATPVVIDSFDYATLGLGETPANVSLERIDPDGATQDASNWAFTLVPPGANTGEYVPGGTPGAKNSVTP